MVSLMQRRREMMRLASVGPSINDYVQDGILFWLDGIKNTRAGHDASAARWEDLCDDPLYFTYNENSVIGDKYCIPNGKMAGTSKVGSTTTNYTIEIVTKKTTNDSSQMICPWKGNNFGTLWIGNKVSEGGGQVAFGAGTNNSKSIDLPDAYIHTCSCRGYADFFLDGVAVTPTILSATWGTQYNQIGYYNTSYPRECTTEIYAIRIYKRLLTDAEIALNRSVDAARFGNS